MLGLGLGFGDKQHKARVLALFHPARGETTNINHTIQFSCSVMSDSLQPHELQQARPPCPSLTPEVYSNSCPSSQWCHPVISTSVVPFSSCPQSFPASGSFPMSQPFIWGGQSTGVSASASVLPMNTQDWSPLGWTGWISLQFRGCSRVFSNTTVQKHQFFGTQLSSQSSSHPYMTIGKTIALTRWTFVDKVMSLLPRSQLWLQNSIILWIWVISSGKLSKRHLITLNLQFFIFKNRGFLFFFKRGFLLQMCLYSVDLTGK